MFKSKSSVKNHKKTFRCPVNRFASIKPKLIDDEKMQEKSRVRNDIEKLEPPKKDETEIKTMDFKTETNRENQMADETTEEIFNKKYNEKVSLRPKCDKCDNTFRDMWVLKKHITQKRCKGDKIVPVSGTCKMC